MAKRLQLRGGTTSQHSSFTGAIREVTVDTDKDTLVVHDGSTAGGHPLATATNFKSTGIDDNSNALAITIDSSEHTHFGLTSSPSAGQGGVSILNYGTIQTSRTATGNLTHHEYYNPNGQVGNIKTSGSDLNINASSSLTFYTNNAEKMRILADGKVGIGTSNPTTPLEVNGVVKVNEATGVSSGTIIIDATATGNPNLVFEQAGTPKGYIHYIDGSDTICLNDGSGNGLHYSPTLKRLGIDTNSPSQALDVVGNAEINGNIFNNGQTFIRKDGGTEHLVITNETGGSNASPQFADLHFNRVNGKDGARIRSQDQSNNKSGGFMKLETATDQGDTTDGSGLKTRIFLDNDGDIFFYEDTGTTAKVKWDATNEKFGIGNTIASSFNDFANDLVVGDGSSSGGVTVYSSTSTSGNFNFADGASGSQGYEGTIQYNHSENALKFWVNYSGNSSPRMIIDSSGVVLIGKTSSNYSTAGFEFNPAGRLSITKAPNILAQFNLLGTGELFRFHVNATMVGGIVVGSSSTSYNTSSDYRLKENVTDITDATTRLKQLKPKRFNFIADADTTVDGFIAHEVSSIVPEAISGTKDETETKEKAVVNANGNIIAEDIEQADWETGKIADEDGNTKYPTDSTWEATKVVPVYQGIDQAKLVPLLVKTIQELEARITALETTTP